MNIIPRNSINILAIFLVHNIENNNNSAGACYGGANSPNSRSLLNIGNGLENGPSVCNAAEGRKGAHHCVEKPISGIW